ESSWCDSACERCPLLSRCAAGQAVSRRLHQLEDEDGPDTVVADLTRDLNRALVILEQACLADGIDPDSIEPVPTPPVAGLAESLGADLVRAAVTLTEAAVRSGRTDQAISSRLVGNSTLMAVKTTRVAWALAAGNAEPLEPLLLLIEHTSGQLRDDSRLLGPFVVPSLA